MAHYCCPNKSTYPAFQPVGAIASIICISGHSHSQPLPFLNQLTSVRRMHAAKHRAMRYIIEPHFKTSHKLGRLQKEPSTTRREQNTHGLE
jgi:hypothetical protein